MEASFLWKKRQEIMTYEDQQEDTRSQIDHYKNHVLGNDKLLHEIIAEHNDLAAEFEAEVEEATKHLQSKLEDIANRKKEIQAYSNYILINDELLSELTKDYNITKEKWKKSITEYTVGLDSFVDSGEVKNV